MLKNILNLEGVQLMSKKEQLSTNGSIDPNCGRVALCADCSDPGPCAHLCVNCS